MERTNNEAAAIAADYSKRKFVVTATYGNYPSFEVFALTLAELLKQQESEVLCSLLTIIDDVLDLKPDEWVVFKASRDDFPAVGIIKRIE